MAGLNDGKGPRRHRILVYLFAAALTVLIYWLAGFVVQDIGSLPGPDYDEVEKRLLDPKLTATVEDLEVEIHDVNLDIGALQNRQARLRESTDNSRQTMDQLLDIQKQGLERDVKPTPEEQVALAEAEKLFLDNQRRYQELNDELAALEEQRRELEDDKRAADQVLEDAREPVREEYDSLQERHDFKMGVLKLSFLVPLLLVSGLLLFRTRGSAYVTLVYALGIAVALKVAAVMHEHFPTRYFKYILILVLIALVLRVLVYLLRMMAHPQTSWLLKQYREAYESFLCPVCGYPIRRGPLKYLFWTRRSIKKLSGAAGPTDEAEKPYTCPACTTRLYEACPSCGAIRHSLLPACDACGAVKTPETENP